jgi:hypothetical protein
MLRFSCAGQCELGVRCALGALKPSKAPEKHCKWHHLKFRRVLEEMEGHPRHLDVGCGPGTLIGLLDDRFKLDGNRRLDDRDRLRAPRVRERVEALLRRLCARPAGRQP